MIDAMMAIVSMTPTQSPSNNDDVFHAPTPEETFAIPDTSSGLTLATHVAEWLPVLAGVAVGVVLGVVATLIVIRVRRRHRFGVDHS
ncbi:hypothetical protein AB0B45_21565 [Nonomuraea sp. NPDC049152]|uniref:hypothetical protein n=1 Tax=Nonomuraea sp. NPDC049152 TaxID=3154350 RepID=UPI0034008D94